MIDGEFEQLLHDAAEALDRSDYSRAEELYLQATRVDEASAPAWMGLGNTYSANSQPELAVEAFEKAIEFEKGNSELYLALARELLGMEGNASPEDEEEASWADQAEWTFMRGLLLADNPADVADDWYNLALCNYRQGAPEEAIPFCRRALQYETDADAERLLGNCHYDLGRYEAAAQHFKKSLEQNPDQLDCAYDYAQALELIGQPREALIWLEKILEAEPERTEVHEVMSRCYRELGDYLQADKEAELAEGQQH